MICQRCGEEFKEDIHGYSVRIADGLYAYQDSRYELCPKCLAKVRTFVTDKDVILVKKYTKLNQFGGKVTSRVTGYEEIYI